MAAMLVVKPVLIAILMYPKFIMNTQLSVLWPRYEALMLSGPGEWWRTIAKFARYEGLKLTFSNRVLLSDPGSIVCKGWNAKASALKLVDRETDQVAFTPVAIKFEAMNSGRNLFCVRGNGLIWGWMSTSSGYR